MTPKTTEREVIDGAAGALEVVVNAPLTTLSGIALIAHPLPLEGGTLDNKVVYTLAKTFFALGYAAVRFNFRGVGASAGVFDEGNGETDDALAALAHGRQRYGNALPIVLAGFSFGSFVQTRVAHRVNAERMVLIAPAVNRFPTERVPPDTIVVHGEQDDVVPLADVFAWARPQELPIIVFPGCGHFFHGRLPQLQRAITGEWQPRRVATASA
ncbi:MAG: alpha/beta hydrolase [Betaproteobacteria bacterium]|nr:MAG: alpha/beta hydrolase [Betaproteobacteria bacterium]